MKKILIVEDEEFILLILKQVLEQLGFCVTTASSSQEGIALIEKEEFDLLITDKDCPQKRAGFEVIRAMRAKNPDVGVILMTGRPENGDQHQVNRLVCKPFNIDDIMEMVRTLLHLPGKSPTTAVTA